MWKALFKVLLLPLFLDLAALNFASAADLTAAFTLKYNRQEDLNIDEQKLLRKFDIYLVPGILSESFLTEDGRSKITFAKWTGDYFGTQKKILSEKYGLSVTRLSSSSQSVNEIRYNIRKALETSRQAHRKAIFMTHSLGGLALLEELVVHKEAQSLVGGIVFLQSPFRGTPLADLYFDQLYYFNKLLRPVIPFFNTSEATIRYLGTKSRGSFMAQEQNAIARIVNKIPLFTVAGVANGSLSLFKPSVILIYNDYSDGMVPLESSHLPNADSILLKGVDHGETVVDIPFVNYDKGRMTEALFKVLAVKIKNRK